MRVSILNIDQILAELYQKNVSNFGCKVGSSKVGSFVTQTGSWLVESDHVTRRWRHVISGVGNRWPVGKKGSRAHGTGSHVI